MERIIKNSFNVLKIHWGNLEHNLKIIQNVIGPHVTIMPIVKDNAYGHGLVDIGTFLVKQKVSFIGVNSTEEALYLRRHNVTCHILIMGAIQEEDFSLIEKYNLDFTIYDKRIVDYILNPSFKKNVRAHLKINTGMNRLGLHFDEVVPYIEKIKEKKNIEKVSLMSHLAEYNNEATRIQINDFEKAKKYILNQGLTFEHYHIANSGGTFFHTNAHQTMVRTGLSLYGYLPVADSSFDLKPALSFLSKIVSIKKIPKGQSISYNRNFTTKRDSIIGVVPVGYADGYFKSYGKNGYVVIKDTLVPIVGDICMDMFMIDLTDIKNAEVHDSVLLIGNNRHSEVSVYEIAKRSGLIPYEILTSLSRDINRVYE